MGALSAADGEMGSGAGASAGGGPVASCACSKGAKGGAAADAEDAFFLPFLPFFLVPPASPGGGKSMGGFTKREFCSLFFDRAQAAQGQPE